MASSTSMLVVGAVLLALAVAQPAQAETRCYTRVFSFGDSLADTGNYRFVYPNDTRASALWPPYGETYFGNATGRFSNGRVVIDFIADALGLPFVPPYWGGQSAKYFAGGANFAVGGATALSPDFFWEKGVPMANDTVHLDKEMVWFRDVLKVLCPNYSAGCRNMMKESLFLVGEIGGNDYNLPFFAKEPFEKIRTFTPSVVDKISSTITELIRMGAKTLLVPGNLPIGCVPAYLTMFKSNETEDYEPETGCIRWMNEFAQYHNKLLVDELDELRKLHPGVAIIYADYYGAAMEIFLPPKKSDCTDMMNTSLFLVGEIGGNDYNIPLLSKVPFEKISNLTPSVVANISSTITELIGLGAKTLLVPGNLPIGCVPKYLMIFKSDKAEDYEPKTGCLRWMNEFSEYHNRLLLDELEKLRNIHSGVSIIYADYYGAAMEVFLSPKEFGIEYPLVACCGGRGPYGVSETGGCGYGKFEVCPDPENYGSWDGFHPSEAVYEVIANGLLCGSYTQPSIATTTNSCPQLTEIVSCAEYKGVYDL